MNVKDKGTYYALKTNNNLYLRRGSLLEANSELGEATLYKNIKTAKSLLTKALELLNGGQICGGYYDGNEAKKNGITKIYIVEITNINYHENII